MNDMAQATADADLMERFNREVNRADELMKRDPRMPQISALVIASDLVGADENLIRLEAGELDYKRALVYTGSYGRLELMLGALDKGLISINQALDTLIDYWSGSDPDDTDERFLPLWYQAWERNGNKPIVPGSPLPDRKWLTVYRGQDLDAPLGCAWSLDRKVAQKFADGAATRQSYRNGVVITGRIERVDVLAYFSERNEAEVILDPETVKVKS